MITVNNHTCYSVLRFVEYIKDNRENFNVIKEVLQLWDNGTLIEYLKGRIDDENILIKLSNISSSAAIETIMKEILSVLDKINVPRYSRESSDSPPIHSPSWGMGWEILS